MGLQVRLLVVLLLLPLLLGFLCSIHLETRSNQDANIQDVLSKYGAGTHNSEHTLAPVFPESREAADPTQLLIKGADTATRALTPH
ncbi:hypothetical protein N9L68_08990 [bacterium]|nr:hypothetical protein [bacterium]